MEGQAFRTIGWKFFLVFIILAAIGSVWIWIYVPETKGIPLEEMARVFGDEVAVYAADIHADTKTHELVVDQHNGPETHNGGLNTAAIKKDALPSGLRVEHIDTV